MIPKQLEITTEQVLEVFCKISQDDRTRILGDAELVKLTEIAIHGHVMMNQKPSRVAVAHFSDAKAAEWGQD